MVTNVAKLCSSCSNYQIYVSLTANCGNPLDHYLDNHGMPLAVGYFTPALEGDIVMFSCPPGLLLYGSNLSTCMGNGKWEPDPRVVKCQCIYTYCMVTLGGTLFIAIFFSD